MGQWGEKALMKAFILLCTQGILAVQQKHSANGKKNRKKCLRLQELLHSWSGWEVCAVPLWVFLPSLLTFPDSNPLVCIYLSWAAAGNLPTYCLLPHCQKVQSVSSQAWMLRLCWTAPCLPACLLPEWDNCGGGELWSSGLACCTLLRVIEPVNEPNTCNMVQGSKLQSVSQFFKH